MRFFSSELGHEYAKTYTFGYCNYGVLEPGDDISDMYASGYLPYSGSPESKGMFYMARSARIYLPEFELNSECRRVAKKFDGTFSRKAVPLRDFDVTEEFITFWLDYFARAHGPSVVSRERVKLWLDFGIITHIGIYKDESDNVAAYTLEVADDVITHDWYQSWSREYDKSSLGMWLLIDIARTTKARGAQYYYCGTAYSENSYKSNLPALEFWNGTEWNKDTNNKRLNERLKTDGQRQVSFLDEWKQKHPLF